MHSFENRVILQLFVYALSAAGAYGAVTLYLYRFRPWVHQHLQTQPAALFLHLAYALVAASLILTCQRALSRAFDLED